MVKEQHGNFGYKIGRITRLMHVEKDADLLWQILVREIYILMKHYGSIEALQQAFKNITNINLKKTTTKLSATPNSTDIEKCRPFTNLNVLSEDNLTWEQITYYCQHSFINILESGYFLNNGSDTGFVFILDFTNKSVKYYWRDLENKMTAYENIKIDEIMTFEDIPTNSFTEIVTNMMNRFNEYDSKIKKVNKEIEHAKNMLKRANEIYVDTILMTRTQSLLYKSQREKIKIEKEYRYFYYRLDDLNMIDYTSEPFNHI